MADYHALSNCIQQIADLLRGSYWRTQYDCGWEAVNCFRTAGAVAENGRDEEWVEWPAQFQAHSLFIDTQSLNPNAN